MRVRSEFGDERFGVLAADGGVDGKIAGFAERFKGEPGPKAVLGIGSSVEAIDLDRWGLILKGLKVSCVRSRNQGDDDVRFLPGIGEAVMGAAELLR